jgi:DNA modification methylase
MRCSWWGCDVKPYYEHAGITIYHGDCREVLPTLPRADLVLTDPPYGIGRDGAVKTTGSHGGRKAYEFMGWDDVRPTQAVFEAVLGAGKECVIWGGNYFADLLPARSGWLVWDKGQRINQSDGELAWTSRDCALRIFTANRVELMLDGAVHPTQKPWRVIEWCLSLFPDAEVVIDPFMGSGTTLVAAKDLGRRAIGIEIEERYCEIAARRLAQEVLPL